MIQQRKELETLLNKKFIDIATDDYTRTVIAEICQQAREKYNISEKETSDFVVLRRKLAEADTFHLYALADVLNMRTETYFTQKEIEEFSQTKLDDYQISFPLRYKMTRINDGQFIGKISVKELMKLKEARLINYNENSQRTMKRIIKGDSEFYQIYLNKKAVNEIIKSYESGLYIPNTITLNMPEETEKSYNEDKAELVIKKIDHFDIIDGYHRYIAMSKIVSQDPDFNYEMELRIVQFEESKAKRFIWQEDQKTKMRKIDSDSMNPAKTANKIVNRINMDDTFILAGKISRNKGIINAAYLADIIDILFVRRTLKSQEGIIIKQTTIRIINYIEDFVGQNEKYLDTPWDRITTLVVIYDYYRGVYDHILEDIEKVKEAGTVYQSTKLQKADITKLKKILSEGG